MAEEYTKEELLELYEQLPETLKKAVYSPEIGNTTLSVCREAGMDKEKDMYSVLKKVGYVFLGILSPDDFKGEIKSDLKIEEEKAEKIYSVINKEVFGNLKKELELLYGITLKRSAPVSPPKNEKPKRSDRYLEPIE
ncbi:MAG: hypothetical protein A2365_00205 [Candidatus Nealsonbacteria bacterium RIFOXYB1_FULL_40_15]|uniref:Uncharacterized protein n=2 Tax=Candidatus Nealsoniibacteriota TaxID=1817911 RepID=A0A1G2ESG2_9BACT|nr:MAG: hypothetical protein A2365_00205 [Candidatus Nealsonbacteria bacterium RIFOXYB1_FULL_40_15]OGZ28096.1 MAG: hypothetical protein A2562_01720 [Candidatus Nealsonbacteria bacterium RIFOXYD1_FULL_39_11]OGZ28719.1 MAG: hypothetical protein A2427_03530 [Candidatus Nealsonbacteria bacterium RIFOXYC1_FULL_40_7]